MLDLLQVTEAVSIATTKSKRKHNLLSLPVHVDTETSKHIEKDKDGNVTMCYGWIYLYGLEFAGAYTEGRTPTELLNDLELIRNHYGCSKEGTHLVVFIHNLSFDLQYLKDFLMDRYGGDYDLLAIAPHRFISFRIDAFEFRCTLKLSNRSLDKWAKDLGVENQKAVGEIDYEEKHYQDEPLSPEQHHYMRQDVLTLRDCVREQMRLFKDNLQKLPLTSTGYVRREIRKNFRAERGSVERFRKCALDENTYVMCHSEFSGGLTHGNRFYAGEIVEGNIQHCDFRSFYPSQQRAKVLGFPKGKFQLYFRRRNGHTMTLKRCFEYAEKHCLLIEITISDLKIKKGVTLPYAQSCKFVQGKVGQWSQPMIEDNGRILQMFGASTVVLTELDLTILVDEYTFGYTIHRVYSATRGSVPNYLAKTVDYYFSEKCRLKELLEHLEKGTDEHCEAKKSYALVKAMLNSIYGCTATNIVRTSYYMDTNGNWSEEELTAELLSEKLEKYYKNFNSCMAYQHGIYTTSLSRFQLWFVVAKVIGYENFLYCDTDSAFYLSSPEVEARIAAYNKKHEEDAIANGAFVEVDGQRIVYDQFENEGENITRFVFLHAKAYAYEDQDGLHCTVAGVSEKNHVSGVTREQELGSLEEFKAGKKFIECGGTRSIYVEGKPHIIYEDGHKIELAGSCVLDGVSKTLSCEIEKSTILYDDEITFNDQLL